MEEVKKSLGEFNSLLDELGVELRNSSSAAETYRVDTVLSAIEKTRKSVPKIFLSTFNELVPTLLKDTDHGVQCVCGAPSECFYVCAWCPKESRQLYCKKCSPLHNIPCNGPEGGVDIKLCQSCMISKSVPFYCTVFCCLNCDAEHPSHAELRSKLEQDFPQHGWAKNGTHWSIVHAFFNGITIDYKGPEYDRLSTVVVPKITL